MDTQTFSYVIELIKTVSKAGDVRKDAENFFIHLREQFVFDNVAVYIEDELTNTLEIVHARAVGRAKNAEADADWGETFAGQVFTKGRLLVQEPEAGRTLDDRLQQAYLLGIPLKANRKVNGALVFVRFGGPAYEEDHLVVASLGAQLLSMLFERKAWMDTHKEFQALKQQMQLQEDFVSTISHELRTPLGFIKGYSTSLLRKDTSGDQEPQTEFLTIIDEEADRLSLLIE